MKVLSWVIFGFFLTFSNYSVFAQEDVKAKHEAYYLCINTIEKDHSQAYQYCSVYLKKYPQDEARLVEFVKRWLTAYDLITLFIGSTEKLFVFDEGQLWAIFKPDLEKK